MSSSSSPTSCAWKLIDRIDQPLWIHPIIRLASGGVALRFCVQDMRRSSQAFPIYPTHQIFVFLLCLGRLYWQLRWTLRFIAHLSSIIYITIARMARFKLHSLGQDYCVDYFIKAAVHGTPGTRATVWMAVPNFLQPVQAYIARMLSRCSSTWAHNTCSWVLGQTL